MLLDQFREIWLCDFEFRSVDGRFPEPVCLVAKELRSGRVIRIWEDTLRLLPQVPFDVGNSSLFIAYFASAELGCFLSLGWNLPANILDLFTEFRNQTNGLDTPNGVGLLGALAWHGLDSISAGEKESYRDLVLRGNYTGEEKEKILHYCESDVISLEKLLHAMAPKLPPQALLRGRYMKAVAIMERNGVPIDVLLLSLLQDQWEKIKSELIIEVDRNYGVFDGKTFKRDKFVMWLKKYGIPWPLLESGQPALDEDTFKEMAKIHPELEPLRQLRFALSQMRLSDLAIGPDGRNRCLLSPFRAKTGRNQPSNAKFIFGPAVWIRGFIRPGVGRALAYLDWEQQEFGIGAALSGDTSMITAYESGDPYLTLGKMAKVIPQDATKETYPKERDLFKSVCLGIQYSMGPDSLALRLGVIRLEARNFLDMHKTVFKKFWSWSNSAVDYAILHQRIFTVFGWQYHVNDKANDRSLRNFPIQANGAEMLRIACCLATEQRIRVCAPVHDALLIEAPDQEIDEAVRVTQAAMKKASEIVLGGFPLRSEAKVVRYPDRYMDGRGKEMWGKVMGLLKP